MDWLANEIHDGIMGAIDTSGWDKKEWDEFYAKCQTVASAIREETGKRLPKKLYCKCMKTIMYNASDMNKTLGI